ncbi:HET-domain-containing protein [Jackrogersella minutella]|nr:HET-domain-containing protein [Jackrogersella minutella]
MPRRNCLDCNIFYLGKAGSDCTSTLPTPCHGLPLYTGSNSNLEEMQSWARECDEGHKICHKDRSVDYLPTRVIDVSRQEDKVFIIEGEGCRRGPYVALSHCWGEANPIRTVLSSLPDFRTNGISLESFPKTFRDAVSVTRLLQCPYLWIDSLCIIQDDIEDWVREAPLMAVIYSKSYITIAAAWSMDCTGGLFYDNAEYQTKYMIKRELEDGTLVVVHVRPAIDHSMFYEIKTDLKKSEFHPVPLLRRCWFFQEHFFSTRIMFFTNWEVVWECDRDSTCICGLRGYKGNPPEYRLLRTELQRNIRENNDLELWMRWLRIIRSYTEGQLTYDSDRLAALAAIAAQMSNTVLGRYISGLWESRFVMSLSWCVEEPPYGSPEPRRTTDLTMPSWSWASVIGKVRIWGSSSDWNLEVIDIMYEAGKENSFVEANARAIIVRGMVSECKVWQEGETRKFQERCAQGARAEEITNFIVDIASEITCTQTEAMPAYMLHLGGHGIVLRKLDDETDTYQRLGIVRTWGSRWEGFTSTVLKFV